MTKKIAIDLPDRFKQQAPQKQQPQQSSFGETEKDPRYPNETSKERRLRLKYEEKNKQRVEEEKRLEEERRLYLERAREENERMAPILEKQRLEKEERERQRREIEEKEKLDRKRSLYSPEKKEQAKNEIKAILDRRETWGRNALNLSAASFNHNLENATYEEVKIVENIFDFDNISVFLNKEENISEDQVIFFIENKKLPPQLYPYFEITFSKDDLTFEFKAFIVNNSYGEPSFKIVFDGKEILKFVPTISPISIIREIGVDYFNNKYEKLINNQSEKEIIDFLQQNEIEISKEVIEVLKANREIMDFVKSPKKSPEDNLFDMTTISDEIKEILLEKL